MTRDTSESQLQIIGEFRATITRHDGRVEQGEWIRNQVLATGLNLLAQRAVLYTGSAFAYLAVGTVTAAASLGSTVLQFGEVSRKTPVTLLNSKEWFYMVCTWGGAADSVTSVVLESAAMVNHASSGEGTAMNIVNGVAATLANSDFLNLEARVRVGSHAI